MKKTLLALAAMSLLTLASCGNTPAPTQSSEPSTPSASQSSSTPSTPSVEPSVDPSEPSAEPSEPSLEPSVEPSEPSVEVLAAISNKEALQEEWHVGDADRSVELDLTPRCNILEALSDGRLTITSSNTEAVVVLGRGLQAIGAGEATITINYLGVEDSVAITVLDMVGEGDYEVKHLTEIMAIDQSELVPSGKNFYYKTAFLTQVEVKVLGNKADGSASADKYGNIWVTDPTVNEEQELVQVYGSGASISALSYDTSLPGYKYSNKQDFLLNENTKEIKVGDILDVIAIRADYNSTKEISLVIRAINGKLISNATLTTNDVTAIPDSNNVRKQLVTVTGKITGWKDEATEDGTKYGNFYLKTEEENGEPVYVYGATASEGAITLQADGSLKFTNPKDFLTNPGTKDLKIGDEVTLFGFRCDYQGKIELNGQILVGVEPVTPAERPTPIEASVADLLAKTAPEDDKTYKLTGVWENPKGDKYGNGYLTDPLTGDCITVYGLTATASALAFDGTSGTPVFNFTNPQDFLTNETTAALKAGQVITVEVMNAYYAAQSLPEIKGILLEVGDVTTAMPLVETEAVDGNIELSGPELLQYGDEITVTATPDAGKVLESVKVYNAFGTAKDITETLKFNATCVNRVVATFADASSSSIKVSKTAAALAEELQWVASAGSDIGTNFKDGFAFDEHVTISFEGTGNTGTYWTSGSNIRVYGDAKAGVNGAVNFSVAEGYVILTVKMTYTTSNNPVVSLDSDTEAEVNAASYSITAVNGEKNGQLKITAFEVVYAAVND